jgi:myo-inositol-1(or 4)-monophosphatase
LPVSEEGADLEGLDLAHARDELAAAVRAAGAIALKTFQRPLKSWLKEGASPVSEADIAVNDFLREKLVGGSSGFGWRSEESEQEQASPPAALVWIVDPIDGTRSYIAGRPDWVISVALVAKGRPIVAAVFAPASDELFLAARGAGATRNGLAIRAASGPLEGAKVGGPKRFIEALAAAVPGITATPRLGSLALRIARVAHGALDVAFASADSHDWDLAGADLLVHEAGGTMTSLVGRIMIYNQPARAHGPLLAAGADRHAALLALTRNWAG